MKKRSLFKSLLLIFFILVFALSACKKDDPAPTEQEHVSEILTSASAWQSPVVTVDGVDYSNLYTNFSITFLKDTYTSINGSPVWKPSGSWKFKNEEATIMMLDNTQEVEIKTLPDDFIELSLQWNEDTFVAGRGVSVKGKQKFKLKKKP